MEDFPNIYSSTAIDTIIHLTCYQLFLVQLTCEEVVELLNRCTRSQDSYSHRASARRRVFPGFVEKSDG